METTLQNTLVMAQTTADDIKNMAKQQADSIINEAQKSAKDELTQIDSQILMKQRELEELKNQCEVFKTKMESMLVSQLELLKSQYKN